MNVTSFATASTWPSSIALLVRQIRAQLTQFVRIPVALFFTILMPLGMLLLFNSLFAGNAATVEGPNGEWPLQQFYVGSLAAFTAVSGTFTNLANMIPDRRENGIMKRWRGTPLPRWAYIGGFVGSGIVVALGGLLIMLGVGVVFYGTDIEVAKSAAAAVTFFVGTTSFAALGAAVGGLIRTPDAGGQRPDPAAGVHLEHVRRDGRVRDAEMARCREQYFPTATFRREHAKRVQPDRRCARIQLVKPRRAGGVGARRRAVGVAVLQMGTCCWRRQ